MRPLLNLCWRRVGFGSPILRQRLTRSGLYRNVSRDRSDEGQPVKALAIVLNGRRLPAHLRPSRTHAAFTSTGAAARTNDGQPCQYRLRLEKPATTKPRESPPSIASEAQTIFSRPVVGEMSP